MQANTHPWRKSENIPAEIARLRILADTCQSDKRAAVILYRIEKLMALEAVRKMKEAKA